MPQKKATNNINKEEAINTFRQCFPTLLIQYKQCLRQLPRNITSPDENLTAVFRTMWKMNLLIKSILGDDAVSHIEPRQYDIENIDVKSALKEMYKTLWKVNSLIIQEFNFDT